MREILRGSRLQLLLETFPVEVHQDAHAQPLDQVDKVSDHVEPKTVLNERVLVGEDLVKDEPADVRDCENRSYKRVYPSFSPQRVLHPTECLYFSSHG